MLKIAVEEAFVTQEIADAWETELARKTAEPGFRMMGQTMLGHSPGARQVRSQLIDMPYCIYGRHGCRYANSLDHRAGGAGI